MLLALALTAVAAAPAAPGGETISADVDLTETPAPFTHYWKRCVGSGHLLLGTRAVRHPSHPYRSLICREISERLLAVFRTGRVI